MAAGLWTKVLVVKLVSMRSSRLPFWLATRMYEPSGAGNAACACRVPVLPTVVSKQFSGLRALGVEDHDVSAGDERQDRVRVLVVEQDHVRAHGVSARRGPAEIGRVRAQIEPGDRPRARGAACPSGANRRRSGAGRRSPAGCRTDRRSRPRSRPCRASGAAACERFAAVKPEIAVADHAQRQERGGREHTGGGEKGCRIFMVCLLIHVTRKSARKHRQSEIVRRRSATLTLGGRDLTVGAPQSQTDQRTLEA